MSPAASGAGLKLQVSAPASPLWFARGPVIKQQPGHCYLRPFDWFIRLGRTEVGHVTFVVLDPRGGRPLVALMSIVVTPGLHRKAPEPLLGGRRVSIFPAWGKGQFWAGLGSGTHQVGRDPHHITVEADPKTGTISSHVTATRDLTGRKPWSVRPKPVRLRNRIGLNLGTLVVRSPFALDLAGTVVTEFEDLRHLGAQGCEHHLESSLARQHPILELPERPDWGSQHHLQMNLMLTPSGPLRDEDHPLFAFIESSAFQSSWSRPDTRAVRHTKIPLCPTANLVVAFSILPGVPKRDFLWV